MSRALPGPELRSPVAIACFLAQCCGERLSSASNRLMRASQRSGTGLGASRSNASRIVLPIRSMIMAQCSVMRGKLPDRCTVPDKKLDPPRAKHFELCLNRAAVI